MATPFPAKFLSSFLVMFLAAAPGPAAAVQVFFKGGASRNFSDPANWNTFPQAGDHIAVSAATATEAAPAVVDPGFSVPLGLARIYSGGDLGLGTSHVEVAGGATLNALAVLVGNNANEAFDGRLILRPGASLKPTHANSGGLSIGGAEDGMDGEVVVEAGAALFSHAKLEIFRHGRLKFVFGPDGVTPFTVTNNFREDSHRLDGILAVDLASAPGEGTFKFIDGGASKVSLGGALFTRLQGTGGAVSGNGDFSGEHFAVTGGAGKTWSLAVEGRDLVLRLGGAAGEPASAPMSAPAAAKAPPPPPSTGPLPPPVDPITWDLASWRAWPFDYQELSTRKAPLQSGEGADWTHTGDSWVAEKKQEAEKAARVALKPETPFTELKVTDFYITGGGNENGPNRIFCASAVPVGLPGPFPVLFVFHGGGGHASGSLALAMARNNPGFAGVAVDYNGQFRPSKTPVTKWVTQTEGMRGQRLDLVPNPLNFSMYHNTQATRRVLDWVEQQPWADKNHFGAVGISYGGWLSFFLAGVDERIRSVFTAVSAAGTGGMRGRSSQAHDFPPAEQVPIWKQHADPIAYAGNTRAPVFMRLAANDRFFWIDGAANHRAALVGGSAWLLIPNSDHGNGGPDLPEPAGLWHRAVHAGGVPFPRFAPVVFSGDARTASVRVEAQRPLQSVHLAWSPGSAIAPARYWRWIPAEEKDGLWQAPIPAAHAGLEAVCYFTAIDVDGRAVSSDLARTPGAGIAEALAWDSGCLWDGASGAAAWRSDLSFDKCAFATAEPGRVKVTPLKAGARAVFLTNSFAATPEAAKAHRGLRVELSGNGAASKARVLLLRDYTSLDEAVCAAEVEVPAESAALDLPWDSFKPAGRGAAGGALLPTNGLGIASDKLPAAGITVGRVSWLD